MSGCPVCRAGFRGTATCPRCGADLTALMSLLARAWRLREAARDALTHEDWDTALRLAAEAQQLHATPAGRALLAVLSMLMPPDSLGPARHPPPDLIS